MKFEFVAGNLALDFANSVHQHGFPDPQDDLKAYEDLVDWSRQAGLLSKQQGRDLKTIRPAQANLEFGRALELREDIYAICSRTARGKRVSHEALQRFNRHLREAMTGAGIQPTDEKFALTWQGNSGQMQRVRGEITRAAISLLTSDRLHKVRQCEGQSCTWLFLDTSRNGLRRWCDMQACGNRAKVRRFRKRNATVT